MALLTIPPAWPAPSPTGYNPRAEGDWNESSRGMRTGLELRVSAP